MIITISRQAATNGACIAHMVAAELGYHVYDRELVDEIARRIQVDPGLVTRFDETPLNSLESLLWEWRSSLNEYHYRRLLRQALGRIALEGNAVILGRGANFLLNRPTCLNVRIVAPMPQRIDMYCAGEGVTEREAYRWIHTQDRRRAEFVRRLYHADIDDPLHYNLVINLAALGLDQAATLIVQAVKVRALELPTLAGDCQQQRYTVTAHHPRHQHRVSLK
jgi:cytidylate kinase